jgi:5-methylcytosine-specific restriction endonuclease McrA
MSNEALQSSVLVLNRGFAPVRLTTARRALCMLFNDTAEVVLMEDGRMEFYDFRTWAEVSEFRRHHRPADEETEWISTVRWDLQVPRVIRLLGYSRYPKRHVGFNRRNIFARDENRCQYCGEGFPSSELSLDHVLPLSRGGLTNWENVVCACTHCNKRKGGRTPAEAGMTLVRRPVEPKYNPLIRLKLQRRKYDSWKQFLNEAYWSVPLE